MRIIFKIILTLNIVLLLFCSKNLHTSIDIAENSPPLCSIIYPNDGDTLIIGDIVISVDASDVDGQVASVKFFIDDVLLYTDTEEPYDFVYTYPWIRAGYFDIRAVAVDSYNVNSECTISTNFALFMPVNPYADTIFVPQDYSSIGEAVDNSQSGDIIMIADGSYWGCSISHPLNLIGSGENTVIDHPIEIHSDNVVLRRLCVNGDSYNEADGTPAIAINNSANILIDSLTARGGFGGTIYMDTVFIFGGDGGSGVEISNSSNIIVQNSRCSGNSRGTGYNSDGQPGDGVRVYNSTSIFIVNTKLNCAAPNHPYDAPILGNGVSALHNSLVGIRNCEVNRGWSLHGEDYYYDESSIIIFP